MLNSNEILQTLRMIDQNKLDVRTITMGISLLECAPGPVDGLYDRVYDRITRQAEKLVPTGEAIEREFGIPIVNKRITVTPISLVGASSCKTSEDFVKIAHALDKAAKEVGYPVIVKPADSGSSVGIEAVHDRDHLIEAIENAAAYSKRIIVEHLVEQLREINCSVLGDYYECEASVCEAPLRSGEILSYQDKYLGGGGKGGAKRGGTKSQGMRSTVREIPARLPQQTTDLIRTTAVETFKTLGCDGVARIDFMTDDATGKVYVNEINTIPGSLSFYLWEASGVSFDRLIDRLIEIALRRSREASFKITSYKQNIFNYSTGGGTKGAKGTKA